MDENTLLNSDLGQGDNSSQREIFIVFKENVVVRCVVLEEQTGLSTFKLRELFHVWELDSKVGQLKGKWPSSDDAMKYTATYYLVNAYFLLLAVRLRGFFCLESSTVEYRQISDCGEAGRSLWKPPIG